MTGKTQNCKKHFNRHKVGKICILLWAYVIQRPMQEKCIIRRSQKISSDLMFFTVLSNSLHRCEIFISPDFYLECRSSMPLFDCWLNSIRILHMHWNYFYYKRPVSSVTVCQISFWCWLVFYDCGFDASMIATVTVKSRTIYSTQQCCRVWCGPFLLSNSVGKVGIMQKQND